MAFLVPIPLKTPWLLTDMTLYIIAGLLGAFGFTPIVKRQIQLLDSEGFDSPNYQAVSKKATLLGVLVGVDVVIIVFLMVVKPALWG